MKSFFFLFKSFCAESKPTSIYKITLVEFFSRINFIFFYHKLNDLIWQEGFLIDFLQKKIIDNWIKKFLILTAYLFNERLVFEKIIKYYLNLIIWPQTVLGLFEAESISGFFFIIYFILASVLLIFGNFFFYYFMF